MGSGHYPAMRTAGNQVNVVSRRFNSYPCRPPQRAWAGGVVSSFPHPQALLGDAVVPVAGALKDLPSPRGGLAMPLTVRGSESAGLLVREELGPDSPDHVVPGIHGAGAAHHGGQNSVGPPVSATFRMAGPLRWRRGGPRAGGSAGASRSVVMRSEAGGAHPETARGPHRNPSLSGCLGSGVSLTLSSSETCKGLSQPRAREFAISGAQRNQERRLSDYIF